METQLIIAQRQGYLSEERVKELATQCVKVTQLINGLIRYIEKRIGQRPTVNGQPRQ